MENRVKSVYSRTSWAVMASPVNSIYFRPFCQNYPPSHAKSLAFMVSRAKSCRGILRTKGGGVTFKRTTLYINRIKFSTFRNEIYIVN